MIPTHAGIRWGGGVKLEFQSRNRETYDSNKSNQYNPTSEQASVMFQSRNRETYDSNHGDR